MPCRILQPVEGDTGGDRDEKFTIKVLPDFSKQLKGFGWLRSQNYDIRFLNEGLGGSGQTNTRLLRAGLQSFRMTIDHEDILRSTVTGSQHPLHQSRGHFAKT